MAARKVGESTEKKAGNRGMGRRKGSKNKMTMAAKQAIELAAEGVGGADRLIDWIKEDPSNEKVFWSQMYTKLLPLQVNGSGDNGEHRIIVSTGVPRGDD